MPNNNIKTAEKTWDIIAKSFDITRRKPWKQCIEFINELSESDIVADLGCGNGRHLILCAKRCKNVTGLDISQNLLRITQKKIKEKSLGNVVLVHGNLVELPLKDNSLDAILYIASLHNIKGRENRINSLKEINRILKNDGTALISVWSRWQDRYRKYFLKQFFIKKDQNEFGDIDIYWRQHNLNIPRFYHLYSKREFVNDLNQAGLKLEKNWGTKLHSKISADNYFAIVKKGNCY